MLKEAFRLKRLDKDFRPALTSTGEELEQQFEEGFIEKATVLFVDIASFSSTSSGESASRIRDRLKSYYEDAIPVIDEHRGVVEKCIGDGIICCFGKPFYDVSDRIQKEYAIEAGKDLVQTFGYESDIKVSVAVAHGEAYFGYLGTAPFREPTMVGEVLTRLFRLEGESEESEVTTVGTETGYYRSLRITGISGPLKSACEASCEGGGGWSYKEDEKETVLRGVGGIKVGRLSHWLY